MTRLAAVIGGLLFVGGCCQKYKCSPPTTIAIRDSSGKLLANSRIEGAQPSDACPPADGCSYRIRGTGAVTASAPGHKPVTIKVELHVDDCDNTVAQTIDVVLVPDSAVESSTSKLVLGDGCS